MVMTNILDGKKVQIALLEKAKSDIDRLKAETNQVPGLAVIIVGDNPASKVYVASKQKTCESLGMYSVKKSLNASISQDELHQEIESLNQDPAIHGILLQLPLPKSLDSDAALQLISPDKDVDGFHPENVGKLLVGLPTFKSCTPYGVCELLDFYNIETQGQHVVILGRSNIVGKPLAAMLVQKGKDATVTICHSRTKSLETITSQADILIAAIGKPEFVTSSMVKEGAVVIDVGINRIEDASHPKGSRLVGDVHYESVQSKASAITPVPGGVGPLTIAMLMKNTLQSFKQHLKVF